MNIHPSAIVSPSARIAADVEIGPFCIVHDNVEIGAGTRVGAYCELGVPSPLSDGGSLRLGNNSLIRSHSVFYASSSFGDGLETGHRVTIREHTVAGSGVRIGTLSDLQGDCELGEYVRLHSNVHIGKRSVVNSYAWIFPYVVLTNDPTPPSEHLVGCVIDEFAVVATMSVILPGVKVGRASLVAAHACVGKDVPPGAVVAGVPAKVVGLTADIRMRDGTDAPAYPWADRFHRGYPQDVIDQWRSAVSSSAGHGTM